MRLISGFKGSPRTDMAAFNEATKPKHAAISLIGEPTLYPNLNELIAEFHARDMTTFVVTNGTNPDVVREIKPTQLYLSLNATEELGYKKVARANYWARVMDSLEELRRKSCRTVIRITCMEELNMENPEGYAELVKKANPDFVEVKAYMHIGYSRKRLSRAAMPAHARVKEFASEISNYLTAHRIVDESEISRVVLISNSSIIYKKVQ
jgi:tRNA wybutosine-synthesizing protein 1